MLTSWCLISDTSKLIVGINGQDFCLVICVLEKNILILEEELAHFCPFVRISPKLAKKEKEEELFLETLNC